MQSEMSQETMMLLKTKVILLQGFLFQVLGIVQHFPGDVSILRLSFMSLVLQSCLSALQQSRIR
ncbi:hypothetical protein M6B38_308895 [Iris pallida]|uniref:Uncharacterized protein n=1 Tax=Iris pallida TaxID=29817 RepID=A0AAX6HKA7_IRIPA|nr:hypothetical protein M6B38_308895 [Iris pallida]